MSTLQLMLYAAIIAVCASGVVIIVMLLHPWSLISKDTAIGQKNRYKIRVAYSQFTLQFYETIKAVPITRTALENLALTLKYRYTLELNEAKIQAATILIKEAIVLAVSISVTMYYYSDKLLAIITTIMIVVYAFNKFMGDGEKFLAELEETVGDMVHIYNAEGQNVERMFKRIMNDKHIYLYRYLDVMWTYLRQALMEPDKSKMVIAEYNKLAPSRHLRLIFNYIYITARYGDETNKQGEQLFNKNMLAIQREVHADLVRMQTIKAETIGEQIFIIFAVVMIPAADWYMKKFFTFDGFGSISRFLNSSFGYSIKITCGIFALICFYLYNRLMMSNKAFEDKATNKWADTLLEKHVWLRRIVDKLAPKEDEKEKREKLYNKLTLAEGYANIRVLYLKKLLVSVVLTTAVVLFLSLDTFTLYKGVNTDLYIGVNGDLMDVVLSLEEFPDTYKQQALSNDQIVMDIIKQNPEEYNSFGTTDEKVSYVTRIIRKNDIDYGAYPEVAAQRICEKMVMLDQVDPSIIIVAALITMLLSYMIPNITLELSLTLNQGAIIYDEVIGYYTVVILLANHSASNIHMIFEWITSFATIFKRRLQQCMDNMCEKEIRALEEGVEYKPLSRLIECLLLAYKGTDLQSAFAGIEQRHLFQEESRKILNEQIIRRRTAYSQALSWFAMGCTFMLYIVTPMILAIVEMLGQLL